MELDPEENRRKGGGIVGAAAAAVLVVGALAAGWYESKRGHTPFYAETILARAFDDARSAAPDAELALIFLERVAENGEVQVKDGFLRAVFRSPAKPDRDPQSAPAPRVLGESPANKGGVACPRFDVHADFVVSRGQRFDYAARWKDDCKLPRSTTQKRRCTVPQVWQRAIAKGAPQPALADMDLIVLEDGALEWGFWIIDRSVQPNKKVFSIEIPDDCSANTNL